MTTWSILVPVSFSTVRTTNGGPPDSKARLIVFVTVARNVHQCGTRNGDHICLVTSLIDMKQHDGVAAPPNIGAGLPSVPMSR